MFETVDNSLATIKSEDRNSCCLPITSLIELHHFVENPPTWVTGSYIEPKSKKRERGVPVKNIPLGDHHCHVDEVQWEEFVNKREDDESHKRELLICHDMKNNYLEDRFINGNCNHDAYRFYRWSAIDTFVYFSHHFVTIPPVGWINTAHRNGVNIFGTVITEWNDGSRICAEILQSEVEMQKFVQSLVHLCKLLQLDGWLINIENRVPDATKLCRFVELLTEKQHKEVEGSRVLWYDSVIKNGDLRWQNELNERNSLFYEACDGIFINYTWTNKHLERTHDIVGPEKAHTVFIGVDVFGRNQYGGGGFNTKVAVDAICQYGFSTAMFAPAWTHETICRPVDTQRSEIISCRGGSILPRISNDLNDVATPSNLATSMSTRDNLQTSSDLLKIFFNREDLFWNLLLQFYPTKEFIHLPFSTSFCQGSGLKKWTNGQVVYNSSWFNINKQQIQPSIANCPLRYQHMQNELLDNKEAQRSSQLDNNCMESYFEDSFLGGSCLKFTKINDSRSSTYITRLFICNFDISRTTYVRVVTKSGSLTVVLLAQTPNGMKKIDLISNQLSSPNYGKPTVNNTDNNYKEYVASVRQDTNINKDVSTEPAINNITDESICEHVEIYPLSNGDLITAGQSIMKQKDHLYIHPGEKNEWSIRYFLLPNPINIREIGVKVNGPPGCSALLGEFAIIPV